MTPSKVKCFEDNYRRDSFDDRICDDLSEVILQYLPIEDKFKFECVSKQFQGTVLEKENELVIDKMLTFKSELRKSTNCRQFNERSLLVFENILKKLPKIRCLKQKRFNENLLSDRDMDLINTYCRRLTSIHCDLKQISSNKSLAHLAKIVSFSADINSFELIRSSLANVRDLNCFPPFYSCPLTFSQISELQIKNLKRFSIQLNDNIKDHLISFQEFVENNRSLTHLTLDSVIRDENVLNFVYKQITRFEDLIELSIISPYKVADISLINGLKQISLNCAKLRSLSLSFVFVSETSEITTIFKELQKFKQLKRLSIEMFGICVAQHFKGIEVIINNSMRSLKDLTDVKIAFPKMITIEDIILKDIDKDLPKLKSLYIKNKMEVTEQTVHILSRLSRLESLDINVTNLSVATAIETEVANKCSQIKLIKIVV